MRPFKWLKLVPLGSVILLQLTLAFCELEIGGELLNLFDFQQYQTLFDKHYKSQLEATTRHVYLLDNAIQVYATALAYQSRALSHYEALNYLSDLSPFELRRMLNKVMGDKIDDTEKLAAAAAAATEPVVRREKREIDSMAEGPIELPRRLTMSQLIQIERANLQEPANVLVKLDRQPQSNNPNYDSLAMEQDTRGFIEQQEEAKLWRFEVSSDEKETNNYNNERQLQHRIKIKSFLSKLALWPNHSKGGGHLKKENEGQHLPDEMFSDLSKSGCMLQPRKQGACGACYAFAGITMAEFLVCKSTGKLMAFSEQYVLDCGTGRLPKLMGCAGGDDSNMPNFIHNFGLELLDHYPYKQRVSQCPYNLNQDLKTTGFYRMELKNYLLIPVQVWADVLKESPIYVGVAVPNNFHRYAGGVDSGLKCSNRPDHAMLVVGHGREEGQEFWLLRNSFGTGWGAGGYYKLAKSAPARCIEDQEGYVYGTRDGVKYKARAVVNVANVGVRTGGN